jgi:ABC-type spermidine/putrescine transport system permease subunit I
MATQMSLNLQGAKKDILLSLAIIFVPNLILTAVLLGLVFHYQVPQTHSELPGVPDPLARESSAYLVDFSATKLLTVASWTSTLSSLLPSFAMALVSFPVARKIANASKNKRTDDLPTPYQHAARRIIWLRGIIVGLVQVPKLEEKRTYQRHG